MHSSSWQNLVKSHPKWKLLKITLTHYMWPLYISHLCIYTVHFTFILFIFSQNSTESLSLWVFWGVQVLHYPFPVKATQIYNKISIHLINHHLRTFHKPRCHNFEKGMVDPNQSLWLLSHFIWSKVNPAVTTTQSSVSLCYNSSSEAGRRMRAEKMKEFFCIPEWKLLL